MGELVPRQCRSRARSVGGLSPTAWAWLVKDLQAHLAIHRNRYEDAAEGFRAALETLPGSAGFAQGPGHGQSRPGPPGNGKDDGRG